MEGKHLRVLDYCGVPHDTGWFEITRGHSYYWIVKGPVPLDVAKQIYADSAAPLIRVAGHAAAPAPVDPWITWKFYDGTELASLADEEEFDRLIAEKLLTQEHKAKYTFTDDPNKIATANGFIETYHIDSDLGLRVFVDYLRNNNLL